MISRVAFAIFGLGLVGFLANVTGCSNQAEGQACSVDNVNADCEDGLECQEKAYLKSNVDTCCKPTGSTHPACIPGNLGSSSSSSSSSSSGAGGAGGTGGSTGEGGSAGTGGGGGAGGSGGTGGSGGNP